MARDSGLDDFDPTLADLNHDLNSVEQEIELCFASMDSTEAAFTATARLREYRTRLEAASDAFVRARVMAMER